MGSGSSSSFKLQLQSNLLRQGNVLQKDINNNNVLVFAASQLHDEQVASADGDLYPEQIMGRANFRAGHRPEQRHFLKGHLPWLALVPRICGIQGVIILEMHNL